MKLPLQWQRSGACAHAAMGVLIYAQRRLGGPAVPACRVCLLPLGDLRDIFAVMRIILSLLVLIGALWAADTLAYGGRYGRAVWTEANYRGQMFRDQVAYWLRSLNR